MADTQDLRLSYENNNLTEQQLIVELSTNDCLLLLFFLIL